MTAEATTHNPASPPRRVTETLLLLAAFALFAGLLVWQLGAREFWLDEQVTVGHIRASWAIFDAFHPPGYYFLLRQWSLVFGQGDLALRAFSVPWALLGLLLVWLIARLTLPRPGAVLTVWLCATSPALVLYLRMARYFAPTLAAALAVVYFALLCRRAGRWWHYLGLGLSAAGLLWLHYLPSLLLPLLYLWLVPTAWRRGRERWWWLAAVVLPVVLYLPQIARALTDVGRVAGTSESIGVGLRGVVLRLGYLLYGTFLGETTDFWRFAIVLPVAGAGVLLWLAGMRRLARGEQPEARLAAVVWPLAGLVVLVTLCTVAASEPWPRGPSLSLFALPLFYLTLAAGAAALRRPWGLLLVAVFLLGEVYGTANYFGRRQFLNPGYNVPWRQVADLVAGQGKRGDLAVVIMDSSLVRYWHGPVALVDHYGPIVECDVVTGPVAYAALEQGGSVWAFYRDRGGDFARRMGREFLGQLRERTLHEQSFPVVPRSRDELLWRSRVQGHPAETAYLTVYRFSGLQPGATPFPPLEHAMYPPSGD